MGHRRNVHGLIMPDGYKGSRKRGRAERRPFRGYILRPVKQITELQGPGFNQWLAINRVNLPRHEALDNDLIAERPMNVPHAARDTPSDDPDCGCSLLCRWPVPHVYTREPSTAPSQGPRMRKRRLLHIPDPKDRISASTFDYQIPKVSHVDVESVNKTVGFRRWY